MMNNHKDIFEAKYELDHIMRFTIKIDSNYPLNGAAYGTILPKDAFLTWIRNKFCEETQKKSNAMEKSPSYNLEDHTSKSGFDRDIA